MLSIESLAYSVAPEIEATLGDTVLIVQCCDCYTELVGQTNSEVTMEMARNFDLPRLAGRVMDRPYCAACLTTRHEAIKETTNAAGQDGAGRPAA